MFQLKKLDDDVAQKSKFDRFNPDNRESEPHSDSAENTNEMENPTGKTDHHLTVSNGTRLTRRAVSECADGVSKIFSIVYTNVIFDLKAIPIRGILKMSRTMVRRTVSESQAGDQDTDEVFVSSPDISFENEERTKKCVHFNDRIFMNTFRSNSSILSRKNKTLKRTLRRKKKLSGSESSSDIESHDKSNSSTEDLKINYPPELPPTPTIERQGNASGRKVMVVKPLLENGTTFTVTPVEDSELEDKHDAVIDTSKNPGRQGRQDSGYDSEESREANEGDNEEGDQVSWQEVKSKSRRRKSQKPHTDQLRKESRKEVDGLDQQESKENGGSRTNEIQIVVSA